jgi:hypothetical protein
MIPLAIPAVLKAVPWKLVGYAVAVLAILALGWRISVWREAYKALPEVKAALAAEEQCLPASSCGIRVAALQVRQKAITETVVKGYEDEIREIRSRPVPERVIRVCRPSGAGGVRVPTVAGGTGEGAAATGGVDRADEYPTGPFREYALDCAALAAQARWIIRRDVALATPPAQP